MPLVLPTLEQKVIVACYNLDVFRDFVFKTPFLERYPLGEEAQVRIRESEVELLKLGSSYLERVLFP